MNTTTDEACLNPLECNILIVDDEAPNVRMLKELLHLTGYRNVYCTQEPTDVLELYQLHNFDLILLDLNMPLMSGYDVIKQLKEHSNDNLPAIIMLTAQHIDDYIHRALAEGAKDYVTKPFDFQNLLSRVNDILEIELAQKYQKSQEQTTKATAQVIEMVRSTST